MQLWTEYEGRTIEGTYTLGKLLRSEGRNGFFSTADTTGNPAVIRLTEAHYDEDELLKRWRQVSGMHQDNLINIARFGQTDFDGVAITYALMESNDASLDDVLRERPLTLAETMQVARAVHAALAALHASGLVHEHIAPDNVLAVGETVKLRSDCVRECIADIEFNTPEGCAELRRRDIHDFGILLVQCLTLEKHYNPGLNLPDVFRRLIPHMLEGMWSMEQIGQVLNPPSATPARAPAAVAPAANGTSGAKPQPRPAAPQNSAAPKGPEQGTLALDPPRRATPSEPALRSRRHLAEDSSSLKLRPWLLGGLAAVIVCIIVIWHFVSSKPSQPTAAPVQPSPAASAAARQPAPAGVSATAHESRIPAAAAPSPAAAHAPGWYVITYTYNHQGQAQTKADRLNQRHRGFHAEVFSPRSGAPYLVSLGGPMGESEAKALQERARRSGFPPDTYIRNYR
jgi:serine/threonine protein kinase